MAKSKRTITVCNKFGRNAYNTMMPWNCCLIKWYLKTKQKILIWYSTFCFKNSGIFAGCCCWFYLLVCFEWNVFPCCCWLVLNFARWARYSIEALSVHGALRRTVTSRKCKDFPLPLHRMKLYSYWLFCCWCCCYVFFFSFCVYCILLSDSSHLCIGQTKLTRNVYCTLYRSMVAWEQKCNYYNCQQIGPVFAAN